LLVKNTPLYGGDYIFYKKGQFHITITIQCQFYFASYIKISVDNRGFRDNIIIERFWRTCKWEFAYLRGRFDSLRELKKTTKSWISYYKGIIKA